MLAFLGPETVTTLRTSRQRTEFLLVSQLPASDYAPLAPHKINFGIPLRPKARRPAHASEAADSTADFYSQFESLRVGPRCVVVSSSTLRLPGDQIQSCEEDG